MHRRGLVVWLALVLLAVVVAGAWFGWRAVQRSEYERAVRLLPDSTLRATWTDWAAVRLLAEGSDLDADPSPRDVDGFLSRAYDLDLTSTSAVADSTYAMDRHYGFSALDAEWEMLGQSPDGQVVVLGFGDTADLENVERSLRRLGYSAPSADGGVWSGSADLVAGIDVSLTPVMQNVVVLPAEGLVLLSDAQAYASVAAGVVAGSEPSLDEVDGVSALASAVGSPVTAVHFADDFACEALGMASADDGDQALADRLVEEAGGVSPLAGYVMAMAPDRTAVLGMHFESSSRASADLRPRVELATGEAVGQGGTFAERFRVVEARSDGSEVVLELEPADNDLPLVSDLTHGPVLFATC